MHCTCASLPLLTRGSQSAWDQEDIKSGWISAVRVSAVLSGAEKSCQNDDCITRCGVCPVIIALDSPPHLPSVFLGTPLCLLCCVQLSDDAPLGLLWGNMHIICMWQPHTLPSQQICFDFLLSPFQQATQAGKRQSLCPSGCVAMYGLPRCSA